MIELAGRIPPQAVDIERAVIGAVVLEADCFERIGSIINADDFYDDNLGLIWKNIAAMHERGDKIDILTVIQSLRASGELEQIGGRVKILDLTANITSSTHAEYHAAIIREKAWRRRLLTGYSEIVRDCYDDSIDSGDIADAADRITTQLTTYRQACRICDMTESVASTRKQIRDRIEARMQGKMLCIPTGLTLLDENLLGGWHAPDLIVVAAKVGAGKTQMALHFAKEAALSGKETLFFSLEMTKEQLVTRYMLEDSRISGYNLRMGYATDDSLRAVDEQMARIVKWKINVIDSAEAGYVQNIVSQMRMMKRQNRLDFVIIDHLQMIRSNGKNENRRLEIGDIVHRLKFAAKELNVPVMLLCQLSRAPRGQRDAPPQVDDLKESGEIEAYADIVLFIHKPNYYNPDATDREGNKWDNRGKLIIGKYREGCKNREIIYAHDNRYKRIFDYAPEARPEVRVVEARNYYEAKERENDVEQEIPF